jgi:septal ring factor EnvC (AmiA/AmiB activator)
LTGKEELLLALEREDIVAVQLKSRLLPYYLMGEVGFLNVAFSNKNLPELIIFHDSYKKLLEHDQKIITKYRETISLLEGASLARETEKVLLETFISQNRNEQVRLDEIREEQQKLLVRIQSQKGLYEQAVREMQRAEAGLTRSLVSLKKKHKNKSRGFLINKGSLPWPVEGRVVAGFNETVDGISRKCIIIATKEGAEVFSIFAGGVIFTGYKTGFGNMIIIDHGLQHYTVTARLDTILVKEGQQVSSKQKIGTTGDLATLFSKGLYFEIRHGSERLDPLKWMSRGTDKIN